MKLSFYLKYHSHFGESLYITGDTAALGNNTILIEMNYFNNDYWKIDVDISIDQLREKSLHYKYVFRGLNGELTDEPQPERALLISEAYFGYKVYDVWNYAGTYGNAFYTAPFQQVLLPRHKINLQKNNHSDTHIFKIKAPLIKEDEVVCLLGNVNVLCNWNKQNPVLLRFDGQDWAISLNLSGIDFPIAYKYGIYNRKRKEFVQYEGEGNRVCYGYGGLNELTVLNDGFLNMPDNTWRGAGVSIPVFSLRSDRGLGVGEFNDLKLLADWASNTGLKLIQILPINDTTATFTWRDSYPYAAISAFALHPLYVNIEAVAGIYNKKLIPEINNKRKQLNNLSTVDYEAVIKFKMAMLGEIFETSGNECTRTKDYISFFEENKHWLKAYAAFCYLRDTYQSADTTLWKQYNLYHAHVTDSFFEPDFEGFMRVQFYCFVQYHLHLQLTEAVTYIHKKGIVLKGDIPIGVARHSCDTWVEPEQYKMDMQAGAPPDDFAVKGQNWGFPTYNWQQMQQDNFAWWQARFKQMSCYFDAFRIDHILGFFRIWSIPLESLQGIMGVFDPCLSIHKNELRERGIWLDDSRLCMPYITDDILHQIFAERAEEVKEKFLQKQENGLYALLEIYDNQRKIDEYFYDQQLEDNNFKQGLFDLISNIILFNKEGADRNMFNFRIAIDQTHSFNALPSYMREKLWTLYIDYFFKRQNEFWRKESLKKLPRLKAVTNMLVCGEDLGMVPDSVPGVMKDLGILSLEIQRMPKQEGVEFFKPANAPYLSVVTPSTHDMSTVRGWWEEDRVAIQRFFNNELGQSGEAPYFCEPWISRAILLQHLYSPAMWSIFQIQDILGMSGELRRENPEEERINIPANPNHYWRYRMHITLEQLLTEKEFNTELKEFVENSGR